MPPSLLHNIADDYHARFLACLAVALLISIGAIRLWPSADVADERPIYRVSGPETIEMEDIQPTRQAAAAPAPPAPPIPVLVPDDEVLRDEELDFADALLPVEEPGDDLVTAEGDLPHSTASSSGITVGPKTVRFVEPEYTKEARRKRIRAELVVRVLVNEEGRVEESTVVERFLFDSDGTTKRPVDVLGYGLEEAALSAASRWMFRPARRDGMPVASHTILTFTFGIDT